MKPPTLRHRAEFLVFRLAVGFLRRAPEGLALRIGEGAGWLAGSVLRARRRAVDKHLRWAFPERSSSWRKRVARASYRHLGRESVATFRLGRFGASEVRARTDMVGFEALEAAVAQGNGAVVITGHLGNWEIGGAGLAARGMPMDVVAQRQRNPLFDVDLNRHRHRLEMTVVYRGGAVKRLLRSLRKGRVVGMVADQNVRRGGVFVDFFGRKASTAVGPAALALRTGAPVFVGAARSLPGSPQRWVLSMEQLDYTPTGDWDMDIVLLTQAHTERLEARIREVPEQYFWQHRRWKTRPPEERPEPV